MTQNRVIAIAVLASASTSLIVAGILFYFFYRYSTARQRERSKYSSSFRREATPVMGHEELMQNGGTLRGLLVEENGKDVLYLRKADGGRFTSCFSKVWFNPIIEEDKEVEDRGVKPSISISSPIQEVPLISKEDHAIDYFSIPVQESPLISKADGAIGYVPEVEKVKSMEISGPSKFGLVPPPLVIPSKQTTPPPPPLSNKIQPPPPPQLPPVLRKDSKPPAPPPPPMKRPLKPPVSQIPSKTKPGSALPLPPKPPGGFSSSPLKPPLQLPRGKLTINSGVETSDLGNPNGRGGDTPLKLKPLHWDKVPTNAEYSMVWHEITDGSFRFDDKLIESLFGYTAQNDIKSEAKNVTASSSAAQIFLLDPRKSQNTAIVLKSLAISRKEILDAFQEGYGLSTDTLEKLTKISPTSEEAAKILQFEGNPTKLADAESFLYHILKAVPSAFLRINAMLFRSSYDPDILHLKESLQTLELSCKELRNRGVFLKLLEAILKAGNRMNAGTARGDAQGFNLSALRKLSYVKSTDGKTTLLRFVVEQVIRSEGKRCANNQNSKFGSSNKGTSNIDDQDLDMKTAKEEDEKEYILLGLPIMMGLSTEFSNVKKAATIDHENFINMSPNLTMRAHEIRQVVSRCGSSEKGGFAREMKGFLEECEEELKVVREEQTRVMQLVKRTTEYYQAGAAKEKGTDPLQLFAIVKDFLSMVDQVCVDISKKLQKKVTTSTGSSPPSSPLSLSPRTPVRFQIFQSYFETEKRGTMSSSSESEDDF